MSKLNIFLGKSLSYEITGDIMAVDGFAITLIEKNYKNFLAIGDFDSCTNEEFNVIKDNSTIFKYDVCKDETDLELALIYAMKNKYSEVTIHNIYCGSRLDQFIININLIIEYSKYYSIEIKDEYNYGFIIESSQNLEQLDYKYISFIPLTSITNLILYGLKYKGSYEYVSKNSFQFISNEIIENAKIEFDVGKILVIYSNDGG